jgi:hypothetical protein
MDDNSKNTVKQIDFYKIIKVIFKSGRTYLKALPATFVLSCLLILCIPRYYQCDVSLAPELSNTSSLGSMAGIASSFGIDIPGGLSSEDAISPELYPDLMGSTNFVVSLFPIEIKTEEGGRMPYYEYLTSWQKHPWWTEALGAVKNLFAEKDTSTFKGKGDVTPFRLSKAQQDVAKIIAGKIKCSVDKKTDVITISVEDQNPLVCATIADSVRVRLQQFITNYRTNKARNDLKNTQNLYFEAKREYEKARQIYVTFSDANQDLVLESYRAKQSDLENEMQLRYNIYSNLATQLQMAQAKVQERTPAFTTLKCATVPIRPAGPKRMFFVATMTLLAFFIVTAYKYVKTK